MGSALPKQFIEIAGRPILMHTIRRFVEYDAAMTIIVVLPAEYHDYWHRQCHSLDFSTPHTVVAGGKERFYSVKNGLDILPADIDVVGIHDGVRPLVSVDTIERCYTTALHSGNAIPTMPVIESLRHKTPDGLSHAVPRSEYLTVQTPQCFRREIILRAYRQPYSPHFTDDASVVEALGTTITTVDGNPDNIKITTPKDLLSARHLL